MKKWMKTVAILLSVLVVTTSCGSNKGSDTKTSGSGTEQSSSSSKTRKFTDSAGREVEVPQSIEKIAPSGPLAQMVLYTAAPDKLVGLANDISGDAKEYIPEKYQSLPTFGQFYGKKASLNMEALSAAAPDVVIDIGEAKDTVKEDMDGLQKQIDIPTIFIEANLDEMDETYKQLGDLLGVDTTELQTFCKDVIDQSKTAREAIQDKDKKSVYYATGDAGLNTNAEGSFHAQIIDTVGAKNAATGVDVVSSGGGTVISMEQLLKWQPDYIITDTEDLYKMITTDSTWKDLTAVKEKRVYKVPTAPYNFMGFPPSVNRIIGIEWLGNLIYPKQYDLNIEEKVKEFYSLFYHTTITDEQYKTLMAHALS